MASLVNYKKTKNVLCIVPCYNESVNLPALFSDIETSEIAKITDFIFVDDCSKDNTFEQITAKGFPVIRHEKNLGYGGAVKTGYGIAAKNSYQAFFLFPGDAQRKALDAKRMVNSLFSDNVDVIVGAKFHIYSEKYGPIRRRIGNQIFSKIAKWGFGCKYEDVLSGFKVYRTKAVMPFMSQMPNGYGLDIVFAYYATRSNLRIKEIDVACRYDNHTTKMKSVLIVCFKMLSRLVSHAVYHYPAWRTKTVVSTLGLQTRSRLQKRPPSSPERADFENSLN